MENKDKTTSDNEINEMLCNIRMQIFEKSLLSDAQKLEAIINLKYGSDNQSNRN